MVGHNIGKRRIRRNLQLVSLRTGQCVPSQHWRGRNVRGQVGRADERRAAKRGKKRKRDGRADGRGTAGAGDVYVKNSEMLIFNASLLS